MLTARTSLPAMQHHPATRARRSRRRALRTSALLAIATAASATALTAPANAVVTSTSITSHAPNAVIDADYGRIDVTAPETHALQTIRVTGKATTTGAGPHLVRVGVVIPLTLFNNTLPIAFSDEVEVAADGTFSATVMAPPINARLVALPEELTDANALQAALVDGTGPFKWTPVLGGFAVAGEAPGIGSLSLAIRGQEHGFGLVAPPGIPSFGGTGLPLGGMAVSIGALGGVTSGAYGDTAGDVGLSFMGAGGITDQYNDARGGLTVDGTRAYLRDHIPLSADELPLPAASRSVNYENGGQVVVHTQPIYVAANPADDPDAAPLPGGYRPSGLVLERTTVQDHDGRQISVVDRFRSTDGAAHRVDVLYSEGLNLLAYNGRSPDIGCIPIVTACDDDYDLDFSPLLTGPASDAGPFASVLSAGIDDDVSLLAEPTFPTFDPPAFRIPWETGNTWERRSHAEPLSAPATPTSTIYTRLPSAGRLLAAALRAASGGGGSLMFPMPEVPVTSTYGAITFGTRPDSGLFVSDPYTIGLLLGGVSTQFVARFVRDVPAGGLTEISQVYSTGTTPAEVETLAAQAEQRLLPIFVPPIPGPTPPLAPPAPAPAPQESPRKTPRKLTTSSSLKRTKRGEYRFRFRGGLTLPSGVSRSACRAGGGTVMVQIKAGRNTISTRRVKLSRTCRYDVRINFRSAKRFGNRKRLTVVTKWSGNRALAAKPAKRFTVKVR